MEKEIKGLNDGIVTFDGNIAVKIFLAKNDKVNNLFTDYEIPVELTSNEIDEISYNKNVDLFEFEDIYNNSNLFNLKRDLVVGDIVYMNDVGYAKYNIIGVTNISINEEGTIKEE